jgi:hypothetical protein
VLLLDSRWPHFKSTSLAGKASVFASPRPPSRQSKRTVGGRAYSRAEVLRAAKASEQWEGERTREPKLSQVKARTEPIIPRFVFTEGRIPHLGPGSPASRQHAALFGARSLCSRGSGIKSPVNSPDRHRPAPHVPGVSFDPELLFVTCAVRERRKILDQPLAHAAIVEAWKVAAAWQVGKYMIMPDHIHFFVTGPVKFRLPRGCAIGSDSRRRPGPTFRVDGNLATGTHGSDKMKAIGRNGSTSSKIRFERVWRSSQMIGPTRESLMC